MKTNSLPFLRCALFRLRTFHRSGISDPLPRSLRLHLEACPSCQSTWNDRATLETHLRRSAPAVRSDPTPFLEGRILAAVRRETTVPASTPQRFRWPVHPALAALVAVLTLGALWVQYRVPAPTVEALVSAPLPLPDAVVRALHAPVGGTVAQAGLDRWTRAVEQPLDLELQRVLGDARLVASSLASQFVPSGFTLPQAKPHR